MRLKENELAGKACLKASGVSIEDAPARPVLYKSGMTEMPALTQSSPNDAVRSVWSALMRLYLLSAEVRHPLSTHNVRAKMAARC